MSTYDLAVYQPRKMLSNLRTWLEKGEALAAEKKFAPEVLLGSRLAPDMFELTKQVQAACDNAKFLAARLSNTTPPKNPDTESTFEELKARITSTLAFLDSVEEQAFEGVEARFVSLSFLPGKRIKALDYAIEFALPNFYFHVGMAYAILRNSGVQLGKMDYIGIMRLEDA